jgi:hypothetical protein
MTQNPLPRRASAPRAAHDQHAHAIAVLMNMMFVRHLVAVYRHFGGDLLAAIVLGEVAHHNLAPIVNRARTPHELSEALRALAGTREPTLLPTNAFSIAQATGIPRETVRRKLANLMRRGWIEKDAAGNLFVTISPGRAFAAFHHERVQDVLETSRAIESLLHDRPPAAVKPVKPARPTGRAPIG